MNDSAQILTSTDGIMQPPAVITEEALPHRTHKTVRIAVSGDVPLNRLETEIIDAPAFQRLRYIKQLGTTYLVYPTALHTRFDHSLGTLGISIEMIRAIEENRHNTYEERQISGEQQQLIRLLALLHDIGHIPFGHTLEDEFSILPRHDEDLDRLERLVGRDSKIGQVIIHHLGPDLYDRFWKIYVADKHDLQSLGDDAFVYDIVNNTVCADLLDYLKRDCYFCNLVLDMEYRFLNYLYLRREGNTRRVVIRLWKEGKPTPRRDILSELIRLLDNRYLLGERVYFHHAKLVTGAMLAGAVQRALLEGKLKRAQLYELGDETLLYELERCEVPAVVKLATALKERRLWKLAWMRPRHVVDAEQKEAGDMQIMGTIMRRWWRDANSRTTDEDAITELVGLEPSDFLIHCPGEAMQMKVADMKVFWNGELKPLRDCKDDPIITEKLQLILDSHRNLWAIRCFLNPEGMGKSEEIERACNYLFTPQPETQNREARGFFRLVVERAVRDSGYGARMTWEECERKVGECIDRLLARADHRVSRDSMTGVISEIFSPAVPVAGDGTVSGGRSIVAVDTEEDCE